MVRVLRRSEDGWRRLTACVLVLALILQGIGLAWAGAQLAADPAATTATFELCRHDGGTGGGGAPASPAADSHCILCLTAATWLDAAAPPSEFHAIAFAVVPWPLIAWRLPVITVDASARPRGPPRLA